jgi:hypothetical protein
MKTLTIIFIFLVIAIKACSQQTFTKPVDATMGVKYPDGKTQMIAYMGQTGGIADWLTMTNKPATFPPVAHTHSWNDLIETPPELQLINAIPAMTYLPLPQKTTAEINALAIPAGVMAMVWDKSLGYLKVWNGSVWKIYIANQ